MDKTVLIEQTSKKLKRWELIVTAMLFLTFFAGFGHALAVMIQFQKVDYCTIRFFSGMQAQPASKKAQQSIRMRIFFLLIIGGLDFSQSFVKLSILYHIPQLISSLSGKKLRFFLLHCQTCQPGYTQKQGGNLQRFDLFFQQKYTAQSETDNA